MSGSVQAVLAFAHSLHAGDFYAVAAQVLPVLFVVLTVEFDGAGYLPDRLSDVRRDPEGGLKSQAPSTAEVDRYVKESLIESIYTPLMISMFVAGEVVSLASLEAGLDSMATRLVVWAALGVGAAATIFPVCALQFRSLVRGRRERERLRSPKAPPATPASAPGVDEFIPLIRIEGVVVAVSLAAVLTPFGALVLS